MSVERPTAPWIVLMLIAAACIAVTVSYRIYDPDLWQHLAVGRYLWQTHQLPHTQIWTWPTYGAPAILHSWAFRIILWPFYAVGGAAGIEVWRVLTTLLSCALLWATTRRMGARGVLPVVLLVIAALVWRQRSMARPETLAAVLLALELLILETRCNGGRDRSAWLVPVLWLWVQAHISFVIGFAVLAIYLANDVLRTVAREKRAADRGDSLRLAWVLGAAGLVAFLNPYGAGLVWQPFDFFLHQRHEMLMRTIAELQPVEWRSNLRNGLPLLVAAWPVLAIGRALQRRGDFAELALCAIFTTLGLGSHRFMGFYALVAAPFVARDLETWWRERGHPTGMLGWKAALATAALCIAVSVPEWIRPEPRLGIGLDLRGFPVAAADFMATHGVRGRGFNVFYHGGYLLWRFGEARDRLPFMDIHQAGTPVIRSAYLAAFAHRDLWRGLDGKYRFDWVLLPRVQEPVDSLVDFADDDTNFSLVFLDDDAVLYTRRSGPLAALADTFAFRLLPGGRTRLEALGEASERDAATRAAVRRELERARTSSPRHALAASLLANVALIEERYSDARRLLLEAQSIAPNTPLVAKRLQMIAERDSSKEHPTP